MRISAPGHPAFKSKTTPSIRNLLFTQGIGGTLEYFCTFSVFSVLSAT